MVELTDFEGRWQVARRIDDRRSGRPGRFDGIAVLTPDEAGLVYRETGEMRLEGAPPMAATRSYLWRRDGAGIAVLFEDGRPFHRIGAGSGPQDSHWCAPDLYDVTYDFTRWPDWRTVWTVRGPRKDHTLLSVYRPLAP